MENKKEVKNKLQKLFNEKFCEDFEKYYQNEEKKVEKENKEVKKIEFIKGGK